MARRLLIGIDVGTTGLKVVIADADGALLAQRGEEYATSYPQPNWAEQDPEQWWRACCSVVPQALEAAGATGDEVAGIGVSGQGIGVVPVDAGGRPLRPAMIWLDRRSDAQCDWLRETVGEEEITRVNGARIDSFYLAPKWLWVKQHAPEVYRDTAAVLQSNGYLVQRLTGAQTLAVSDGPMTLFFDTARLRYHEGLAGRMGIDLEKMPRIAGCSEVVGAVNARSGSGNGAAGGNAGRRGAVDGTAAAVEGGLLEDGDATEMTGQSTVILVCSSKPYLGRELISLVHGVPGRYLAVGGSTAAGGSLRWWRDQLADAERARAANEGRDPFQALDELAAESPAGANRLVFLPYLFGERSPIWDTDARRRVLRTVAVDHESGHGARDPGRRGVRAAAQYGSRGGGRLHGEGAELRGRRRARARYGTRSRPTRWAFPCGCRRRPAAQRWAT